jgi:hypothetical protein
MKLNDTDLEALISIYSAAKPLIPEKERLHWAEVFLDRLDDYGIDLRANSEEIVDACNYLDKALDMLLSEHDEESWEAADEEDWD